MFIDMPLWETPAERAKKKAAPPKRPKRYCCSHPVCTRESSNPADLCHPEPIE